MNIKPEPAFYITQGSMQFVAVEQSVWDRIMERLYPSDQGDVYGDVQLEQSMFETRVWHTILEACWPSMLKSGMVTAPHWRRAQIEAIPLSLFMDVAPEPEYLLRCRNAGPKTVWDVIVAIREFVPEYGKRYRKPKGR